MMIYELGAGPAGAGPHAKVVKGCGGIIAVAEVISGWALRTTSWEFTLEAECANHDFQGFAPRDALRQFDLGVGLIGFGDGSGILKMLVDEFTRLHKIFKSNNRCC